MKTLAMSLIALLLLTACRAAAPTVTPAAGEVGTLVSVDGGSYRDITPEELEAMLQDRDFVFINTHIPFEGDIPGTDISVAYNEIGDNLALLPQDKGAKIVVYCRSDPMSRAAARTLVGLGYTNVWNLAGGMVAWEQAGFTIEGR